MSILALTGLMLVAGALPARAASTYTLTVLWAAPAAGRAGFGATVKASPATLASTYSVGVWDAAGARVATVGATTSLTLTGTGTATQGVASLSAGTYTYGALVDGRQVGGTKRVTVPSRILFRDDFTGTGTYDHSTWGEWSTCTYNGSAAYGKITCGDRATLDGQGHLSIPATPTSGTSVSTKDDFTFTYGTMTARMKVPAEAGYWPAFWALNNSPDGRDTLPIGEIDAHESYTALDEYYHRAVHNYAGDQSWSGAADPACGLDHIFGEWHDYSAKVEPDRISFYFDGVMCGGYVTRSEGKGRPWAFGPDVTRGLWPILTLAVGGAGGQQDGRAVRPAVLLVDQVTVTALP